MRSGRRSPLPALSVALVAVIGAGVVVAHRAPGWWPERATPQPVDAPPGSTPAQPAAPLAAAPPPQPVHEPPQATLAPVQPSTTLVGPVRAEAEPETATTAPDPAPASQPARPTQAWDSARREYDRALEAYQERERGEGFSWARRNRVTVPRYCEATRQRTAAFAKGCLDYLKVDAG